MDIQYPNNAIIAQILRRDNIMPCEVWQREVEKPLKPFFKELKREISNILPNLAGMGSYGKPRDSISKRQCLTRARWNYETKSTLPQADKFSFLVQLSDYERELRYKIFWGLDWWGQRTTSRPFKEVMMKIRGAAEYHERQGSMGASGTLLRLVAKQYTADQVERLNRNIKDEILEDAAILINALEENIY